MIKQALFDIPISEIRVVNPRTRNKQNFEAIVGSIATVGLKKPITVVKRAASEDGSQYDLVCGQGRMEAFQALGQTTIPANVIDAPREEQFVMSLVENIARRNPSCKDLVREVSCLRERGYQSKEIARKLGREVSFISSIDHLIEKHEADLVEAVEGNRIPLSVALRIASAKEPDIQRALSEAYESGELRGRRFKEARRLVSHRAGHLNSSTESCQETELNGRQLVKQYERRMREQQTLVKRASHIRERLLLLRSAMKNLLADSAFRSLIQAENLQEMPAGFAYDGGLENE
jgi:ParB family chromosome partitioning protein